MTISRAVCCQVLAAVGLFWSTAFHREALADPETHLAGVTSHQAKLEHLRVVYSTDKFSTPPGTKIELPEGTTLKDGSESWDYRLLRSDGRTRVDRVLTGGKLPTPAGTRLIYSYQPERFESWPGTGGSIEEPQKVVYQDWDIGRMLAMWVPISEAWMTGKEWRTYRVSSEVGNLVTVERHETRPESGSEKLSTWTFDSSKDYCLVRSRHQWRREKSEPWKLGGEVVNSDFRPVQNTVLPHRMQFKNFWHSPEGTSHLTETVFLQVDSYQIGLPIPAAEFPIHWPKGSRVADRRGGKVKTFYVPGDDAVLSEQSFPFRTIDPLSFPPIRPIDRRREPTIPPPSEARP